jgi:hypothetical protein
MSAFSDSDDGFEMSESARLAFRSVPPAPLATFILARLSDRRTSGLRKQLSRIAELNQGALSDLDRADFRSYVSYRTGLSEGELKRCAVLLRVLSTPFGRDRLAAAKRNEVEDYDSGAVDRDDGLDKHAED